MGRETALEKQLREMAAENDQSFNNRIHRIEMELAILKVKWGFAMLVIGALSSVATQVLGPLLGKILNLK